MHKRSHRRIAALALLSLLGAALLASAGTTEASSSLPRISLQISPSAISVGGTPQSGGVNVLISDSGKKPVQAILFRLNQGSSASELQAFLKSKKSKDPNEASRFGSIVFDVEAFPGHPSEAETDLAPGNYVALGAPNNGPPKLQTAFTVAAAAAPAALPKPQATIRSIDFDFHGPQTLHEGELVRFVNQGFLVHMDLAFPAKSKAAAKRLAHGMLTGRQKGLGKLFAGPPVSFQGPVSHGAYQQERIRAKPGWYVQVCFMETQEGEAHTQLGMERVIRIAK